MRGILGLAVISAVTCLIAPSAKADTVYSWSVALPLSGGGTLTGSGELVASDTLSTSYDGKYTGYLVSSFTGTYGGSMITGLAPVNTAYANDNLINTSIGPLDWDGLTFFISPAISWETNPVNLFYRPGSGYTDIGSQTSYGTFTLTAVPEPVTGSVLSLALLAVVVFARRCVGSPARRTNG